MYLSYTYPTAGARPARSRILCTLRTLLLAMLLLVMPHAVPGDTLRPFTSDGCSLFPDGDFQDKQRWLHCCTLHDLRYWMGGTYSERLQADSELRLCVQAVGKPEIADLMLGGVRVGGSPYWPTPFRWGYGWSYLRGYQALSESERRQVRGKLGDYGALYPFLLPPE